MRCVQKMELVTLGSNICYNLFFIEERKAGLLIFFSNIHHVFGIAVRKEEYIYLNVYMQCNLLFLL